MGHLDLEAVALWTGVGNVGLVLRSKTAGDGDGGPCRVGNR